MNIKSFNIQQHETEQKLERCALNSDDYDELLHHFDTWIFRDAGRHCAQCDGKIRRINPANRPAIGGREKQSVGRYEQLSHLSVSR